ENRSFILELVALGNGIQCLMSERNRVLLENGSFTLVESENEVAVPDGHEGVEPVQHPEKIERWFVKRVELEGGFHSLRRGRVGAGRREVEAEIRQRARILGFELQSTTYKRYRFVEAVVACSKLACHAIHLAPLGRDAQAFRALPLNP